MLDLVFSVLLGGGLILGLFWLKRKLGEREAKLSSGTEIIQLQPTTDGIHTKLEGAIQVKKPGTWHRILMRIDTEERIDGRYHRFPEEYNEYNLVISNEKGKAVYRESGTLRPFILNLRYTHRREPTGPLRERNVISRIGRVILLEFAPSVPGKYHIEYELEAEREIKTESYHFKCVIKEIDLSIKKDTIPIRGKGEFHHKVVEF
jgi:hypothetical protein